MYCYCFQSCDVILKCACPVYLHINAHDNTKFLVVLLFPVLMFWVCSMLSLTHTILIDEMLFFLVLKLFIVV